MPRLAPLIAAALCAIATPAFADLWAYVDAQGHSHVANRQVDGRYRLFFKGETTLDAPDAAEARSRAIGALAGTPFYARATDPARVRRFASLIEASARSTGLDPALVTAVVAVESAFEPRAVSDKGALGLMQILPETGARYGLRADAHGSMADKLFDPAANLRVGTRYLRDLLARFEDDLPLALAAYNAGEGAVTMHANRIPPFAETRDYVVLVRALYAVYRETPPASAGRIRIVRPSSKPARDYADVASE